MKRLAAGLLFGAASALTPAASPPTLPDCQAHQIRYSLLLRDANAAKLPQPKAWHLAKLTPEQVEDLQLEGGGDDGMAAFLSAHRVAPVTLATRCWAPAPRGDVEAHVATVEAVLAAAGAGLAPVVGDGETGEWLPTPEFQRTLLQGQRAPFGKARVSRTNPPAVGSSGSAFTVDADPSVGYRTRGLRKMGLPDLALAPGLEGYNFQVFLAALGNLALVNQLPLLPDVVWEAPVSDPGLRLAGQGRIVNTLKLRWREVGQAPTPLLRLEWVDAAGAHPVEQQLLLREVLGYSPFAVLGSERAREMERAVARAKLRLEDLRARFEAIKASGGRLWVHTDLASMAQQAVAPDRPWVDRWYEVLNWDGRSTLVLKRWQGDPRRSGSHPSVDAEPARQLDINLADDWLLQDAQGRLTAG